MFITLAKAGGSCGLWIEQSIGKTKCVCCTTFPLDSRGRRVIERRIGVILGSCTGRMETSKDSITKDDSKSKKFWLRKRPL